MDFSKRIWISVIQLTCRHRTCASLPGHRLFCHYPMHVEESAVSQSSNCSALSSPGADLGHLCHILVVTDHELSLRWCLIWARKSLHVGTSHNPHFSSHHLHLTLQLLVSSVPTPPHLTSHHLCLTSHTPISCHTTSISHLMSNHLSCHTTSHISRHTTTVSHLMSHYLHLTSRHTTFISHLPSVAFELCQCFGEKKLVISRLFSRSCGYMNRGTVNVGDVYLFTQTPRERATMVKLK